jgi:hypothetical protein
VIGYVKLILMDKLKLKRLWVPLNKVTRDFDKFYTHCPDLPQCEIFVSPDFLTNDQKLLCLIQGTGSVRAG